MAQSLSILAFLCCFCLSSLLFSDASDSILPNQSLPDGKFIVSSNGTFAMGFFSPDDSKNRFFGIWYKIISTGTVVWVANRDAPVNDTSGALTLSQDGNLIVLNSTSGNVLWSSRGNYSVQNPIAQLLESGNLVIRDANIENPKSYLWQSFDYPSDTALPGMKMGKNLVTGVDRILRSWKTSNDPSTGNYSFLLDSHGFPQMFVMGSSSVAQFRSGPWNGERFSGAPALKPNPTYTFDFVFNQEEIYYIFQLKKSFSRLVISPEGILKRSIWNHNTQVWTTLVSAPIDNCDNYGLCNGYGICDISTNPICSCLDKFKPKNQENWATADWSGGCVRKTPLDCKNDGFVKYSRIKLPDTRNSWYNKSMNLEECRRMCMRNCSCMAYSNIDIRGKGSGCLLWFEDLMDIRNIGESGQDIYIRVASSELASNGRKVKIIKVCLSLLAAILLLGLILALYAWKKKNKQKPHKEETQQQQELTAEGTMGSSSNYLHTDKSNKDDLELPLLDLATILNATNYFSSHNKIGEGGFGPVYKGMLQGQEIAVKRLSKYSTQGLDEFKNEVILIAKLQHRNLVKLLGCCVDGEEKMLVYEFMPNNSLETFIFDENKSKLLDWPSRFSIINGIARGLLYLHQDSRLRIIHRDLKASNILLDDGMNPKISDFGIARSFGGNETEANTRRVVGTYGYMSPEYAIDGNFSVKSDVFSFGVMVLEIISGTRNRGFFHPDHHHNLIGHAWILHNEGRSLELIDAYLSETKYLPELLRSIHIGLLCVQKAPEDRPSMSNVVLMLGSDGELPKPKEPGFFTERNLFYETNTLSSKPTDSSGNELSITIMEAR